MPTRSEVCQKPRRHLLDNGVGAGTQYVPEHFFRAREAFLRLSAYLFAREPIAAASDPDERYPEKGSMCSTVRAS